MYRTSKDRIEFWMALADDESEPPDQKLSSVLPALTSKEEISDLVLKRLDMVCTLAMLVKQLAPNIKREIATDLGYGSAEVAAQRGKRALDPSPPTVRVAKAVGARPMGAGPKEEISSLQLVENSERKKWGHRLQQIAERAGSHAGINDPGRMVGITPDEAKRLRTMTFEAGGFRTIRQNVRYWEKFEDWCRVKGMVAYPPTTLGVNGYALRPKDSGCGPSILPAFKYAVSWVCKRIAMKAPLLDLTDPQLKAVTRSTWREARS